MVAIDVARLDLQSAGGRNKLNGMLPDCRKPKLNRVVARAGIVCCSLNSNYIWMKVSVKVGDCKG